MTGKLPSGDISDPASSLEASPSPAAFNSASATSNSWKFLRECGSACQIAYQLYTLTTRLCLPWEIRTYGIEDLPFNLLAALLEGIRNLSTVSPPHELVLEREGLYHTTVHTISSISRLKAEG